MRWILAIFFLVVLLIADQTWYRGHYLSRLADLLRSGFAAIGF